MAKKERRVLSFLIMVTVSVSNLFTQNYSKQLQQAILLYQEGKNTDAMDRFMDILVSGTPEEKIIASEYISKITQGIPPTTQKSELKVTTPKEGIKKDDANPNKAEKQKKETKIDIEGTEGELVAKKVADKIKEIKSELLVYLNRKAFLKIYMDQNNENPNYLVIKEDKIFNEDLTFRTNILDDLKMVAGLLTVIGKATITILPNGAINGNMKIANVRKATILHSYFQSFGLSSNKVKLDIIGSGWQNIVSKKIDDSDGIIIIIDYSKEPELISESESPQVTISLYPSSIDISKNQASIIEFFVVRGKNPIASWKLLLNKKAKPTDITVQKIENTIPMNSMIVFNGKEKFIGKEYEPGEYEFILEAYDTKGNISSTRKSLIINSQSQGLLTKSIQEKKNQSADKNIDNKKVTNLKNKGVDDKTKKDVLYKVYFEKDSFNITKLSYEALDKFIEELKQHPNSKILITGYAHVKEEKPKTKAYKRANVVKNQLIKKYNVDSKRIKTSTKVVNFKKTIVEISLK